MLCHFHSGFCLDLKEASVARSAVLSTVAIVQRSRTVGLQDTEHRKAVGEFGMAVYLL